MKSFEGDIPCDVSFSSGGHFLWSDAIRGPSFPSETWFPVNLMIL